VYVRDLNTAGAAAQIAVDETGVARLRAHDGRHVRNSRSARELLDELEIGGAVLAIDEYRVETVAPMNSTICGVEKSGLHTVMIFFSKS
jgi:hypothetical protein